MNKVKSNAAELILALITVTILATSCGSTYGTCPAYGYENDKQNTNKVG